MASVNIRGRKSIRREVPISINTAEDIPHHNSQEDLSTDGYASNHADDSGKALAEDPIQTEKLKKQNLFDIKNNSINDSGKDLLLSSSFRQAHKDIKRKSPTRHELRNSITTKSADRPPAPRSCNKNILILLFFIIPVGLAICYGSSKSGHEDKFVCNFSELEKKYPNEDKSLWDHLKVGNENILNNKCDKPAVFLFVHHGEHIAETLIYGIAQTSAQCFGSSPIIKKISFTSKEAIQDYGYVIAEFKNSIKEENVILIANLNEIPGEAAKALHSICDTVSPLVKKVIILLSLTVKQKNSDEKVIETAENALRQLWQEKMKPNELEPVITRVTDQVFLLRSN